MMQRKLGLHLGFPPCCVEHFCDLISHGRAPGLEAGPGPWVGSGFVPCPPHAAFLRGKDKAAVAGLIQNRQTPAPFPDIGDAEITALVERFAA